MACLVSTQSIENTLYMCVRVCVKHTHTRMPRIPVERKMAASSSLRVSSAEPCTRTDRQTDRQTEREKERESEKRRERETER